MENAWYVSGYILLALGGICCVFAVVTWIRIRATIVDRQGWRLRQLDEAYLQLKSKDVVDVLSACQSIPEFQQRVISRDVEHVLRSLARGQDMRISSYALECIRQLREHGVMDVNEEVEDVKLSHQ